MSEASVTRSRMSWAAFYQALTLVWAGVFTVASVTGKSTDHAAVMGMLSLILATIERKK